MLRGALALRPEEDSLIYDGVYPWPGRQWSSICNNSLRILYVEALFFGGMVCVCVLACLFSLSLSLSLDYIVSFLVRSQDQVMICTSPITHQGIFS